MFDKFTNRAKQVIKLAKKEAQRLNHNYLGTEHLLLGLLKLGQGVAVNVLREMGLDFESTCSEVERLVGFGPEIQIYGEPALTGKVKKVFELAAEEASNLNHNYIGTEHLLLGLVKQSNGVAVQVLEALGVRVKDLIRELLKELENFNLQLPSLGILSSTSGSSLPGAGVLGSSGKAMTGANPRSGHVGEKIPALKAYGYDLIEAYHAGKMDPVIGRQKEVERLILILSRRRKNNPVLVGEAGVGKTAIVEGLAQAIARNEVPETLAKKRLIALDLALMLAGTKYRGQFEERIKAVMEEIRRCKNVLLFVDEIHIIVGAGAAEGAIDASNILKPALSRGEIQCIGATTTDEYRKHIEKDAALERRFQKMIVLPPGVEETVEIISGLKGKYEQYHQCEYTSDAVRAAVELSERYISGRYLPDKAIDLLDEAGAMQRIAAANERPAFSDYEYEKELKVIQTQKELAIQNQEYEKAAALRDSEKQLKEQVKKAQGGWPTEEKKAGVSVDADSIACAVSKSTGVPLYRLREEAWMTISRMKESITAELVGQDEIVESVCRAVKRSYADIKDPKRPIGSFLFLGPTGLGKTLLAKKVATNFFGGEDSLIQVDMSEYMEKFAVSRMTGSPPGYVGHEEGGQLTERVRQKPYSVVLFDEIEKAHGDVMDLLLQILEEGRLTDSFGRQVDFRNTIIVMTSNVGADLIKKSGSVGFVSSENDLDYDIMQDKIKTALRKKFKTEFLNRIDETLIFRPFSHESLLKIVDLEMGKLCQRVGVRGVKLTLTDEAREFLARRGFEPELGARPLRRTIQVHIQDPLSEFILSRVEAPGCRHLEVFYSQGEDDIRLREIEAQVSIGNDTIESKENLEEKALVPHVAATQLEKEEILGV
ncbi:ATP-dependent Clp protease ATP-binding subunit [Candidatus Similichlamydia laticola]|uniref:ATP-dependent Clp protease, ATP-binding subunit ClpC n=1 Tax=Candidatus Similichlamydia laticola TaxID=2170265 RepID=A0A369KBP7_9BACT|nr:ATP-dependent Clp protease ATP-binding subunit [Candidatus Similichlamydia laticola]RDB31348.1 ATP-dependent Clp protease, ATP-binding subunit ClpC [Candidatus Similichlamydia laticola]